MRVTRWTGEPGLADLLAAYHLRTESEKGAAVPGVPELPARYRDEVLNPAAAFQADVVLVASADDATPVGCVVVTSPAEGLVELKRLWVAESHRGRGVATALVRTALGHADAAGAAGAKVRLSVWRWRSDALTLYKRLGFVETDPWDSREGLVCLHRT